MIRRINTILLLILILALTACATEDPGTVTVEPTPTATPTPTIAVEAIADYLPLNVGNTWEYEGEGNEYASYIQKVLYSKNNKYQLMMDNGGTLMANVIQVSENSIINTYRLGEMEAEKNVLDEADNVYIELLRLPIEVGNSWISEENSYQIIQTDAEVVVPAGTFSDCVAVKIIFKDGAEAYAYYKKGIGLIQSDFVVSNTEVISSKLKAYNLK